MDDAYFIFYHDVNFIVLVVHEQGRSEAPVGMEVWRRSNNQHRKI